MWQCINVQSLFTGYSAPHSCTRIVHLTRSICWCIYKKTGVYIQFYCLFIVWKVHQFEVAAINNLLNEFKILLHFKFSDWMLDVVFPPLEKLLLANKTTNKYDIFGSCNYSCYAAGGPDQDLMKRKAITRGRWRGKNDECWDIQVVRTTTIAEIRCLSHSSWFFTLPRQSVDLGIIAASLCHPAIHGCDLKWHRLVWHQNCADLIRLVH